MEGPKENPQYEQWKQHLEDERDKDILLELRRISSYIKRVILLMILLAGVDFPNSIESILNVAVDEPKGESLESVGGNQ